MNSVVFGFHNLLSTQPSHLGMSGLIHREAMLTWKENVEGGPRGQSPKSRQIFKEKKTTLQTEGPYPTSRVSARCLTIIHLCPVKAIYATDAPKREKSVSLSAGLE